MWELAQTATTCYLKLCICNVRCEKSLMPVRQNRHQMEPHRSHLPDTPDSHNYSCKTERKSLASCFQIHVCPSLIRWEITYARGRK
ncbi:uncharacterized protein LOC113469073 isoform X2 [Diaphorina citri]|uniref:Uncharacterized protein LOC113469073 isoform X2 n=1 Tax=Diaphorina citri TaxID=121845 RepID=A0A3Q0J5T5_DIACI|nr:uncharacterized protein LOC113469073 isoform X2 [Diaphorina citri]